MATGLTRYAPQTGFPRLSDVVKGLVEDSVVFPQAFDRTMGGMLPSRLCETTEAYTVQLALPGVKPEEVEIAMTGRRLVIKASAQIPVEEGAHLIWDGLSSGQFAQSFSLPGDADSNNAVATYDAGILTIRLPKAEHNKPRTIKVQPA